MAVHIRLARAGAKKKPFYRLVVTDHRAPRGGRFLEKIGTFDPEKKDLGSGLLVDRARLEYWRSHGATPSETVERLLKAAAKLAAAAPDATAAKPA
jgi:small subunit ribosomal protein S16